MKILQICMSQGFGGLELYVLKVAKYLANNNYQSRVLTRENSFLFNKLSENQISGDSFSTIFYHLPLFSAFKLAKYIEKNKVDILHIHWGNDLLFAVLAKTFSRRKVKLVYTRQMSLTRAKDDIYHRFLYRNVDSYIVITRALYNDAIKYLPMKADNIHLLYYGVPAADERKSICDKYLSDSGLDKNIFSLAIFGRVEKGKGQHLVIEAAKNLLKNTQKIQVAIIGYVMDKDYFKQLETEIKDSNIENSIFYLGFHSSPTSIMPCFDAVVLATKCETFGLVLPEAMRAEVAVIGSNCGGVPEIIEHEKTGLLFETGNVEDLTVQISKLVDDSDFCKRLAAAGKIDADERFSEEKHFKKLIDYFESA